MEPPLSNTEKSPTSPSSSSPRPPRDSRSSHSSSLEIRLFYVRISPCAPDAVPPELTLSHLRRSPSSILEINGAQNPISDPSTLSLRRDRVDRDLAEVTYVSTDSVFLSGAVDIEISDDRGNLILCGSLDRTDALSSVQHHAPCSSDKDPRTGWTMDCCTAASITSSAFVQPKPGISSPSFEVYVAGCFAGSPLILTQTVHLAPQRKAARLGDVDSLLEDDETPVREPRGEKGSQRRKMPSPSSDCIGLVGGAHIEATIPAEVIGHFRGGKGRPSPNVVAVVTHDMRFGHVLAGWEGSTNDSRVLKDALSTPPSDESWVFKGKYYLADGGFTTMPGFIARYQFDDYHLNQQSGYTPKNSKELFNLRHSSLCSKVKSAFGILKNRFKILSSHPFFPFSTLVDILLTCCVIHNYILEVDPNDKFLNEEFEVIDDEEEQDFQPHSDVIIGSKQTDETRQWVALRDKITDAMWFDYSRHNLR